MVELDEFFVKYLDISHLLVGLHAVIDIAQQLINRLHFMLGFFSFIIH